MYYLRVGLFLADVHESLYFFLEVTPFRFLTTDRPAKQTHMHTMRKTKSFTLIRERDYKQRK